MPARIIIGDCRAVLPTLPAASVHCCVTSPPYFGLRDYGVDGQIGLEQTPDAYVAELVGVFREVRRVLRGDATCWLNLGDSYAQSEVRHRQGDTGSTLRNGNCKADEPWAAGTAQTGRKLSHGLKPKDLIGIPWLVARALQQPYYTGRIKSERDRVWLAATIDAEGTICGFTHERKDNGQTRRGIHVTITNTNRRMLDEAYRIWPTSRQDHNAHGVGHYGKLDTFRWIAHDVSEKAQLLAELYPYFVCKKTQALLAWNFLEISKQARGRNKGDEGAQNRDRCGWIVHALSKLNHLEHVDLPSWIDEPPSQFEPGYYLRSDVIWSKPNPMPESVTDRPTKAHEYLFLLSKRERYFYDAEAIREEAEYGRRSNFRGGGHYLNQGHAPDNNSKTGPTSTTSGADPDAGRNARSVWTVATQPFSEAHFATFPPALIEPCIKAGCPVGGTVLDPFGGAGTTGLVADRLQRNAILIELNPEYASMSDRRVTDDRGGLLDLMEAS